MILLATSIGSLLVGPALYVMARRRDVMLSLMDGFIFVTITGLVLLYILPDTFANGGWPTLIFAITGLFGPTFLESFSRKAARKTHLAALILGLAGLALHALVDGTALSPTLTSSANGVLLPFAVIIHRFPVGLTIWWLLRPSFGTRAALSVLGLVALATVVGFSLGSFLTEGLSSSGMAWFQAFVAGSLLHVVFHQPHLGSNRGGCGCKDLVEGSNWFEGAGALFGVSLLVLLFFEDSVHAHGGAIAESTSVFWTLSLESAPALLLAYLMAGMLSAFLPHSSIGWMKRGNNWTQSAKGMAVGLPFPICSCGVVPLYRTLVKRGAPMTAAMAFLIATPELGLDAVLLSIPLLGAEMTVIRVVAAGLVALLVGYILGSLHTGKGEDGSDLPVDEGLMGNNVLPLSSKIKVAFKVGLGEVVDHTAPWILLGLAVASMAQPFLSTGWLAAIPFSLQVPLFALLGLPVYVCASGATPFVAVLLFNGVSPGAAVAFLLTGPATNVTTFGLLGQLHGRRVAVTFSLVIIGLSVSFGYLINFLFPNAALSQLQAIAPEEASLLQMGSLIILIGIYLFSLLRRGARKFVAELFFQNRHALDLHPHYH